MLQILILQPHLIDLAVILLPDVVLVRYLLTVVDYVHLAHLHRSAQTAYAEFQLIHLLVITFFLRPQQYRLLHFIQANDDVTVFVAQELNARYVYVADLPLDLPQLQADLLGID